MPRFQRQPSQFLFLNSGCSSQRENEREKKKKRALSFKKGTRRTLSKIAHLLELGAHLHLEVHLGVVLLFFASGERDCRVRERRRRRRERDARKEKDRVLKKKRERNLILSLSLSKESAYTAREKNREEEDEIEKQRRRRTWSFTFKLMCSPLSSFFSSSLSIVFFTFYFCFLCRFSGNFPHKTAPFFLSFSDSLSHQQTRARAEERERWRRLPLPHPPPRER